MSRLIVLIALPAALLSGVALGWAFDWAVSPIWRSLQGPSDLELQVEVIQVYNSRPGRLVRVSLAVWLGIAAVPAAKEFYGACDNKVRYAMSHPQIMFKDGEGKIIDDYRESYWWLRDNTPQDSRVMAWWDYGYQIAGMANRTTIADGNTWNIEHIGMLGLCLSSPVPEAHKIARHLADYVLIWTGGGGDDLGKSAHMARISNSVYKNHCSSTDCDQFGVHRDGKPSTMMGASLIWLLSGKPGADGGSLQTSDKFKEVYVSKHGRVRIVKVLKVSAESKSWGADPQNRLCDAEGSWYCPGQYPPQLLDLFNKSAASKNPEAAAYQQAYESRLKAQESEKPLPNGPGIPKGSYLDSCLGCDLRQDGKQLRCTHCGAPGSPAAVSELDLTTCTAPVVVDNIQGSVQCKPPPNAPDIPKGGYANSCQGCRMEEEGRLLKCSHCDMADGGRRSSSMRNCKAPGIIDNNNGHLTCQGLPNDRSIPKGGYQSSCQGCALEGEGDDILRCTQCSAADASQIESFIPHRQCKPPAIIDNANGLLMCKGVPNGQGLPKGGYQASCQGCHIDGTVLSCSHCQASNGQQLSSSYDLQRCPAPGDLENRDGILSCKGIPNDASIPKGPYSQTCQGCRITGSGKQKALQCSHCRAQDGQQHDTSLVLATCQKNKDTAIGNNNGQLRCEDR